MAMVSAASSTGRVTLCGGTIPSPIVEATATPKINGPTNSAIAVSVRAIRGDIAREEMMVATRLLES